MPSLIVVLILLAIAVIFSVQNAGPVAVSFLAWRFEASLAIVIALSLLGGVVTGMAVLSWIRLRRSRRKNKAATDGPARPDGPSIDPSRRPK